MLEFWIMESLLDSGALYTVYVWDFCLPREKVTPSDVYSYAFTWFTVFTENKMTQNYFSGFEISFSVKTFLSNIYTFQRDTWCSSTDCLLMLRCQLYTFRTVTVHPQELLFRCCMCRLWYVVRTALSGTSRWCNVVPAGRIITYHSLHIQHLKRSSWGWTVTVRNV